MTIANASSLWSASYEPPSEEQLEAVGELVRYVTTTAVKPPSAAAPAASSSRASSQLVPAPAQSGPPWLPFTPVLNVQLSSTGQNQGMSGGGGGGGPGPGGSGGLSSSMYLGSSLSTPPPPSLMMTHRPGTMTPIHSMTTTNTLHNSNAVLMGPSRLGAAAQPGAQALSRQLYRFFHRAFSMWPDQRSIKPLLRAFLAFVAPWQSAPVSPDGSLASPHHGVGGGALASHLTAQVSELVHRVSRSDSPGGGVGAGDGIGGIGGGGPLGGSAATPTTASTAPYSAQWEGHVLSNIPFYLELFHLFLERSISRVSVRGETAVQDVLRVMGVLESSPALVELLQCVERDFNRCAASQPRRTEGVNADVLPWLIEQAQEWSAAATVNAANNGGSAAAPSYAMFTTTGDRCAALAAKDLLDIASGILKPDGQQRLRKCLEKIVPLGEIAATMGPSAAAAAAAAAAMDYVPRIPRSTWRDVRFKGDTLERPITSYEIAALVRLTVGISQMINQSLGLDTPWQGDREEPAENRVQDVLAAVRRRGWRVDLRPLADVRNLFWIPVVWWVTGLILRGGWMVMVAIASGAVEQR